MLQGLFELFFGRRTIGSLQQDSCYKIAVAHIKVEQGKKYLSVPEKGSIQHINDIDDVAEMESDEELAAAAVVEGVVNAVLSCEECLSCVNCSSKITATSEVVNCGKCFAKRKVTNCNMNLTTLFNTHTTHTSTTAHTPFTAESSAKNLDSDYA